MEKGGHSIIPCGYNGKRWSFQVEHIQWEKVGHNKWNIHNGKRWVIPSATTIGKDNHFTWIIYTMGKRWSFHHSTWIIYNGKRWSFHVDHIQWEKVVIQSFNHSYIQWKKVVIPSFHVDTMEKGGHSKWNIYNAKRWRFHHSTWIIQ